MLLLYSERRGDVIVIKIQFIEIMYKSDNYISLLSFREMPLEQNSGRDNVVCAEGKACTAV